MPFTVLFGILLEKPSFYHTVFCKGKGPRKGPCGTPAIPYQVIFCKRKRSWKDPCESHEICSTKFVTGWHWAWILFQIQDFGLPPWCIFTTARSYIQYFLHFRFHLIQAAWFSHQLQLHSLQYHFIYSLLIFCLLELVKAFMLVDSLAMLFMIQCIITCIMDNLKKDLIYIVWNSIIYIIISPIKAKVSVEHLRSV